MCQTALKLSKTCFLESVGSPRYLVFDLPPSESKVMVRQSPLTAHWIQEGALCFGAKSHFWKKIEKKNTESKIHLFFIKSLENFRTFLSICETLKNDVFPRNFDFRSPHTPIFEDDLTF